MRASIFSVVALCAMAPLAITPAWADDHDLTLERLIGRPTTPGKSPEITTALRSAYTGLVSELGVVIAPRAPQPADSLGWSGFAVSIDANLTQVNRDADYWQKGVANLTSPVLSTIGATIRKGLWLPFPSFEVSIGGKKILDSGMFGLELGVKLALHEGYHRWPIPSIALRLGVSHLFGATQLSMTVLDTGILVSKRFPVRGSVTLDPFIGVGVILIFAQSHVVDTTPDIDAYRQGAVSPDENANVTLPDPDMLPRVRLHGGLRLKASLFQLTAEGAYVLCNATGRNCAQGGTTEVVDRSGGQGQLTLTAGIVY
jgi:hypothetical protein